MFAVESENVFHLCFDVRLNLFKVQNVKWNVCDVCVFSVEQVSSTPPLNMAGDELFPHFAVGEVFQRCRARVTARSLTVKIGEDGVVRVTDCNLCDQIRFFAEFSDWIKKPDRGLD